MSESNQFQVVVAILVCNTMTVSLLTMSYGHVVTMVMIEQGHVHLQFEISNRK